MRCTSLLTSPFYPPALHSHLLAPSLPPPCPIYAPPPTPSRPTDGDSWRNGILFLSKQVQNLASRLYRSHSSDVDQPVFDGYVALCKCLAETYQAHPNVIAIETLNEPPMGGLWDLFVGRKPSRALPPPCPLHPTPPPLGPLRRP